MFLILTKLFLLIYKKIFENKSPIPVEIIVVAPRSETEFLLIPAQNNVVRTYYVKAEINNTLANIKCRLCGDRNEK